MDGDLDGDLTLELPLPVEPEGVVVVVVEELESGLWGGTFASFVEAAGLAAARDGYDVMLLPAPQVIHLLAPAQGFAMGPTRLETVVSDPNVARVDFFLDGQREAVSRTAPFTASLDLGALPQPRRIEVLALDQNDRELGRGLPGGQRGLRRLRCAHPKSRNRDRRWETAPVGRSRGCGGRGGAAAGRRGRSRGVFLE